VGSDPISAVVEPCANNTQQSFDDAETDKAEHAICKLQPEDIDAFDAHVHSGFTLRGVSLIDQPVAPITQGRQMASEASDIWPP